MKNLFISSHPVVADRLARLRDKNAPVHEFRRYVSEISQALAYEASANLAQKNVQVETPLTTTTGKMLANDLPILVVPILRAGLGLQRGFETFYPDCHFGYVGLYRDEETHLPVEYLVRLPKEMNRPIFVIDPMVATGHSTAKAIDVLIEHGARLEDMRMVCLIAAPEGISFVHSKYPDLPIYTAALDERLNENAFIVPGLGDAGDRMFGTL